MLLMCYIIKIGAEDTMKSWLTNCTSEAALNGSELQCYFSGRHSKLLDCYWWVKTSILKRKGWRESTGIFSSTSVDFLTTFL